MFGGENEMLVVLFGFVELWVFFFFLVGFLDLNLFFQFSILGLFNSAFFALVGSVGKFSGLGKRN